MSPSIKNGRLLVIITIALTFFSELITSIYIWKNDRGSIGDIVRVVITLTLLYQLWAGNRVARWILVLCLLAATGLVVHFLFTQPVMRRRPELALIIGSLGVMTFILALFLITPWVGAFQKYQRNKRNDASTSGTPISDSPTTTVSAPSQPTTFPEEPTLP
jgi:branched-subunit amino acid ABC-type transport system permease component